MSNNADQNVLLNKSFDFSVRIVRLYQYLKKEHQELVLSKQILRCGTSIGANVEEANGAISVADFSSKISIAYKECRETKYWLKLLVETGFMEKDLFESLFADADEIARLCYAILKTSRISKA